MDNSQANCGGSKRGRAAHGADTAGMLEAPISSAFGALASEKDATYVKNFIDYEVSSINVKHVDVQRFT